MMPERKCRTPGARKQRLVMHADLPDALAGLAIEGGVRREELQHTLKDHMPDGVNGPAALTEDAVIANEGLTLQVLAGQKNPGHCSPPAPQQPAGHDDPEGLER